MELIETRTGLAIIFILAIALFFLRKHSYNPFKKTLEKASVGDPQAQYEMGRLYYLGKHVAQNYVQALNWFDTAAKNGNVRAMTALAGMYNAGHGCEQPNPEKTFFWYQSAADTGDFEARVNLAVCYINGIGVEKNEAKGFEVMKNAADEKSPIAQTLTADLYERGVGVEKNDKMALHYYFLASKQGEPMAKRKIKRLQEEAMRRQ